MATAAASVAAILAAPGECVVRGCGSRTSFAPATNKSGIAMSSAFHGMGSSLAVFERGTRRATSSRAGLIPVRAAKLPSGVEAPQEEPKLPVSLWGFTEKAEAWNSRAAMIGIVGLIILEFVAHRGILQIIGVDVGKGLDLPL